MKPVLRVAMAGLLGALALAAQGQQDPKQSRERELLKRQAEQMRQLEADQATLKQSQSKLADEKAALERDLQSARKKVVALDGAVRAKLDQSERDLEQARKELSDTRAQLAQTEHEAAERVAGLEQRIAEAEARAGGLAAHLTEREQQVNTCSTRNQQMAQAGRDILDRLSDGRCGRSADFRWEPFVQAGRVRFDNAVEAYRDQLAEQRYASGAQH